MTETRTFIKIEFKDEINHRDKQGFIEKLRHEFKGSVEKILIKENDLFFVLNCSIEVFDWSSNLDFDNPDGWAINKIEEKLSQTSRILGQIIIFKDKIKKLIIGKKQYFPELEKAT